MFFSTSILAAEFHVSVNGDDAFSGKKESPLQTIQRAAELARPGDVITVHEGVYRERINPPRGGTSDMKRITYQAAKGEKVVIKGSEVIKGWKKLQNNTWEVTIPNSFFGDFNPYSDLINGDWFKPKGRKHHTGAVYLNEHWLVESATLEEVFKPAEAADGFWFAEVDASNTVIRAQFKDVDPNEKEIEINVRQAVFYPEETGKNYLTVRGFTLMHAATPWAPPTAEQIGLIGTHWSKGWVIENNEIHYSVCSGVTLGKYGDEFDNTSADTAEGYVLTIDRALENGWTKENIGHHVVRNNHISNCEQVGIVGSLGAIFSTVTGNTIHDIHVRRLFKGSEMAAIKFHAPIDMVISNNHLYDSYRGLWLDWMTQGARVSGNLIHDTDRDLYLEVNHGPYLVDNNILLSPYSLRVQSGGGAYVHNLIAGKVVVIHKESRETPYHKAHSTELAGLHGNSSGDDRYYSNIFVNKDGLASYDKAKLPVTMVGNVFLNGAQPSNHEVNHIVLPDVNPGLKLVEKADGTYLEITLDGAWAQKQRPIVTTELLGKAMIPAAPFVKPDGSSYRIDTDYFGKERNIANPFVGPFAKPGENKLSLKVWQKTK